MSDDREPALGSLRERLSATLPDDAADLIWQTISQALEATKSGWGTCPSCGKRVEVQVRDSVSAVRAAQLLIEQTEGRPGVAAGDGVGEPSVLVKMVYVGLDGSVTSEDAERWLGWLREGKNEALEQELVNAVAAVGVAGAPPP